MYDEKRKNSDGRSMLGLSCGMIGLIVIVAFLLALCGAVTWGVGIYNGGVNMKETALGKWADVGSVLQRRLDLYDALVPAIRSAGAQEQAVFDRMAAQSAILRRFTEEPPMNEADQATFVEALAAYNAAAVEVASFVADNPEMITGQLYQDFMVQAEGSENRISTERGRYNALVVQLRTYCGTFPNVVICGLTNMNNLFYFEADAAASEVNLDFGLPE